ncbi:MAG: bifunctional DNA-formamidopyrimidine glycosylase/DNA-(apurinic or apyrimidinic site) lyase [Rubrobacteraceae bacterium]
MPELPEVETIKEDLKELVVGARIDKAEILDLSLVEGPSPEEFVRRLEGRLIVDARRRGKNLVVGLDSGDAVVFQLKIGGQLLLVPPVEVSTSALMLVLRLDGDRRLFLRDETGFTRARVSTGEELAAWSVSLGPEPLEAEFGVEYFRGKLSSRRARIKPLILDQEVVAGVGNIYADEALFDARIHPRRKANTLSADEWAALHRAIQNNLRAGIEHRGTTFSLYRDVLGRKGGHQEHLKVFLRAGEKCLGCGGKVAREKVGGRATFVCPDCQREASLEGEQSLLFG